MSDVRHPWPIMVIDFEASSLERDGYPIEVGLACWSAPDAPVESWSTLIRPDWCWSANGHWSPASAKVHGIRGRDLAAHGREPSQVAAALNEAIGPGSIAWCDGGRYDALWAGTLFKVGGVDPAFVLGDWSRLAWSLGPDTGKAAREWLERAPTPHRAQGDAEQLLLALVHGAGMQALPVRDLATRLPVLAALSGSAG